MFCNLSVKAKNGYVGEDIILMFSENPNFRTFLFEYCREMSDYYQDNYGAKASNLKMAMSGFFRLGDLCDSRYSGVFKRGGFGYKLIKSLAGLSVSVYSCRTLVNHSIYKDPITAFKWDRFDLSSVQSFLDDLYDRLFYWGEFFFVTGTGVSLYDTGVKKFTKWVHTVVSKGGDPDFVGSDMYNPVWDLNQYLEHISEEVFSSGRSIGMAADLEHICGYDIQSFYERSKLGKPDNDYYISKYLPEFSSIYQVWFDNYLKFDKMLRAKYLDSGSSNLGVFDKVSENVSTLSSIRSSLEREQMIVSETLWDSDFISSYDRKIGDEYTSAIFSLNSYLKNVISKCDEAVKYLSQDSLVRLGGRDFNKLVKSARQATDRLLSANLDRSKAKEFGLSDSVHEDTMALLDNLDALVKVFDSVI